MSCPLHLEDGCEDERYGGLVSQKVVKEPCDASEQIQLNKHGEILLVPEILHILEILEVNRKAIQNKKEEGRTVSVVHDSVVDEGREKREAMLVLEVDARGDDWMHQMEGRHAAGKYLIPTPLQKRGGFQTCQQSGEW